MHKSGVPRIRANEGIIARRGCDELDAHVFPLIAHLRGSNHAPITVWQVASPLPCSEYCLRNGVRSTGYRQYPVMLLIDVLAAVKESQMNETACRARQLYGLECQQVPVGRNREAHLPRLARSRSRRVTAEHTGQREQAGEQIATPHTRPAARHMRP